MPTPRRTPPPEVIQALRQEVGFGCPVPGCGNPYLEFHHFDPPWRVEAHHRPVGMIALCVLHHREADGGAFTDEQLRQFKLSPVDPQTVRGRFSWLRNELLAVVGGSLFYETLRILRIDGHDVVHFSRDEQGLLRLNVKMLSIRPEERALIEDNVWTNVGNPIDLRSPPSGKSLTIEYAGGDYLHVAFAVIDTLMDACTKYPTASPDFLAKFRYPVTTVEVNCRIGGTEIDIGPREARFGTSRVGRVMVSHAYLGVEYTSGRRWLQNPSLLGNLPKSRLTACPCGSGLRFKHCHGLLNDG